MSCLFQRFSPPSSTARFPVSLGARASMMMFCFLFRTRHRPERERERVRALTYRHSKQTRPKRGPIRHVAAWIFGRRHRVHHDCAPGYLILIDLFDVSPGPCLFPLARFISTPRDGKDCPHSSFQSGFRAFGIFFFGPVTTLSGGILAAVATPSISGMKFSTTKEESALMISQRPDSVSARFSIII